MARQVFYGSVNQSNTATTGTSLTGYHRFSGTVFQRKQIWLVAGTFKNLKLRLTTAPGAGNSWTVAIVINDVASAMSFTIADTATEGEIETDVSIADGDSVYLRLTESGTATGTGRVTWAFEFEPTTPGQLAYGFNTINGPGVGTSFFSALGGLDDNATVDESTNVIPMACALTKYAVTFESAITGVWTIVKNGVDQDGSGGTTDTRITYTAATTGSWTGSLALVAGDTIYAKIAITVGASRFWFGSRLVATNTTHIALFGNCASGSNTVTNWYATTSARNSDAPVGTEPTITDIGSKTITTWTGLYVWFDSSPGTGNSWTLSLRVNGADPGLSVTIADSATSGTTTGNVAIADGDVLCMQTVPVSAPSAVQMSWALMGGAAETPAQKVTQLTLEVLIDEAADDDPPPSVSACSGSGTVASGTNPSAGTALATMTTPLAWIEVVVSATTYRWAATAINDATPKGPRVLTFGTLARGLSDGLGGFESSAMTVRLSDHDRLLRGLMNTGVLINQPFSAYVADLTTVQAAGTPRRMFHGVIRTFKPLSELEFEIQAEDRFTFATSAFAAEKTIPARLVTSQISDRNPTERVIGKPVPIILGSCSDEADADPIGVVPLKYIASETPTGYDDNLHKFLLCGHALKNVQAIYLANYVSGGAEPTTRIKAPASAYGDVLFTPHQAGWFLADDFTDQASERYTFVYGLDGHLAIELARSGRIPLLANVCGLESVGDATGTMLSNPARCFALVVNNKIAQEATAAWLSQLSLGTYTLLDMTSFEAAATICAARAYLCAGIIGADDQVLSWRELGEWFCTNFDFDWGVNRHGQIILAMLDRTSTYSSATIFTDQNHVLKGSLTIDPKTDEVEDEIQYVYKRNYAEALHAINTPEGSRPNRDPYDGRWFSGLLTDPDETVITENGGRPLGLRQSRVQEYGLIRDAATATDVARQRRERLKRPRAEVTFTVTLGAGDGVELGDVIKLTHFQGATATGYTTRRLQVRRIEDDLDVFTRTFTGRDVDNLLA